jgi:hypothetical protein
MRSSPSWFSAMVNVRHWVARHTNVVLITWFVAVAAVLGGFVVKPLFDRYVARLIDQRQLIEQTTSPAFTSTTVGFVSGDRGDRCSISPLGLDGLGHASQ